jgi:L-alanine-DL-glutamate epimerase-like enolase superfamily enzyme
MILNENCGCTDILRNLGFVKLYKDAGLTGVGECTLETRDRTVMATVKDLERYVLG